jgi:polysaccharide chain length determinant protein (PEP-CTERM system associated)
MLGHRELTIQDYAEILKRRVWLILASVVVFVGVALIVCHKLAPEFVSQTLVIIEQQKVPESYVKPVVTEDLGARLATMREQILSRSRIQPIVESFNLYGNKGMNMDDRVEMTRKAIGINPIPATNGGTPGFYISFKAQDARTAQQVCGEITSLFVGENLSDRQQSAEGTTDFLKQQLDDAKRSLDDQDAKLAAFQRKYLGQLPDQENSNVNTLQALTSQLDAANQTLSRIQQNETFLQAMVSQQSQEQDHAEPSSGITDDERRTQLKALIAQKQQLEAQYTPDYPDVVAISRKIADLQADIARVPAQATPGSNTVNVIDSPQLQQLKAQLRGVQQSMTAAKQEQSQIQQQIRNYEARIESSPAVEEEYKQVTRDHDTALQFYNSLLTKMNESSMATALERREQGEQFRVMDAPNLPEEPTFPKPGIFAAGGVAVGLLFGMAIAGFLEWRDTSVRNERDIWAFTKLPTLAIIAHINGLPQVAREQKPRKLFGRTPKSIESVGG